MPMNTEHRNKSARAQNSIFSSHTSAKDFLPLIAPAFRTFQNNQMTITHLPSFCRTFGRTYARNFEIPSWLKAGWSILQYLVQHCITTWHCANHQKQPCFRLLPDKNSLPTTITAETIEQPYRREPLPFLQHWKHAGTLLCKGQVGIVQDPARILENNSTQRAKIGTAARSALRSVTSRNCERRKP